MFGRKEQFGLGLLGDDEVVVELAEVCSVVDLDCFRRPLADTEEDENAVSTVVVLAMHVTNALCEFDAFHVGVISEGIIAKKTSGELVSKILAKVWCGLKRWTNFRSCCHFSFYFRFDSGHGVRFSVEDGGVWFVSVRCKVRVSRTPQTVSVTVDDNGLSINRWWQEQQAPHQHIAPNTSG